MSWGICCTVGSTAGIAQPKFLFHILEGPTSRYSEKYMAYKIGRVTLGGVKKKNTWVAVNVVRPQELLSQH